MADTLSDITERKAGELEVLQARAHLSAAIETLDSAIVMFDHEQRLVFCNSRYREFYDLAPALVQPGVHYRELLAGFWARFPHLQRGRALDEFATELFARHCAGGPPWELELPTRWLLISERPTQDGGVVCLHTDITQIKTTQRALERALDRAEAASRSKSEFVANVSHELRTPLNGVLGMLQLLDDGALPAPHDEYARVAMQSGRRLLDLINDVLDFSKNQAGLGAIADEPFSLPLLVDEIVAAHVRRALAKGLLLLPYIDPRVPERVRGDAGRLGQVLTNLLGNAIKFTERGEIRVEVRPADDEAERLHLIVDDTGIGIPFEAQQHIFEPFTQVDGSQTRRYGGTGLGLALARQQIELMGGELHLDSAPGRGSRFECRLALRAVGANRRPGDGRVLLVGPAAACRPALLACLQRAGVEVTVSDNPAAASQILRRASGTGPDLVLIDATLQAPDIAGLVGLADAHGRRCAGYGLPADDSLLPPALQSLLPEVIRAPVAYAAVCAVLLSQSAPAARPAGQVRAIDEAVTAQLVDSLGMQAFTTLIDSVEDSVHQRLEVCRAALAGGEMPRVRRLVHTMRGVAANLGAQRFAALCAALERSVAQGEARDPTADAARMSQLADALDEAVAALRAIATRTRVDLGQRARA